MAAIVDCVDLRVNGTGLVSLLGLEQVHGEGNKHLKGLVGPEGVN